MSSFYLNVIVTISVVGGIFLFGMIGLGIGI